jgi:alpha-D-ribose 1-methylphosphonate 5-triphosphate synthase subunit PhnH
MNSVAALPQYTASAVTSGLAPGLDNPTYDSIKVFRAVASAMACPGAIHRVHARPPAPAQMAPACAALCLALLDMDTPLWIQNHIPVVAEYLRFHCGCPITPYSRNASFALITNLAGPPNVTAFNPGSAEYPDDSATLIIQVASLSNAVGVQLSGPGLREPLRLDAAGVSAAYWRDLQESRARFPLGVDIIFVCGEHIAALPRSTQIAL